MAPRLDLGQLQLLAQNLGKLLKRQIHFELMVAGLIASLPLPFAVLRVALADRIARLAIALAHAALFLIAEPKARDLDLRQRDRDHVLALAADHLAVGDVFLESCLILPFTICLKRE